MSGVRVPIGALGAGETLLSPAAARYATRVLRLRVGDEFEAFDPACAIVGRGTLVAVEGDAVTVRVDDVHPARNATTLPLTWIHGLAKGEKLDAIVRDVTELGATSFIAARTARAVVLLDDARAEARRTRWARIAAEAARQCGRSDAPTILVASFAEALTRVGASADTRRFFLYEHAETPLGPLLRDALAAGSPLAFAVGPEGGFALDEAEAARLAGWTPVSLGARILRTETVPAAVLGAVLVGRDQ